MRVWLQVPFVPAERLCEVAVAAERAGLEGVALVDHVCVPADIGSAYPYAADERAAIPPTTEFPDPLVAIAAMAAVTSRLRFTTTVLLVPARNPVLLAKEAATASAVAGGRLDLGVGVGWMREEFEAVGVPFERRGARMDEALPLLRRLWRGDLVEHRGEHFSFGPIAVRPAPPAPIRLLVGGYSDAAIRRAARLGDGWVGVNPRLDELADLLDRLAREREAAGTLSDPFEVRSGVKGRITSEKVRALRDLGVRSLLVSPWQVLPPELDLFDVPVDSLIDALPGLVDEVTAAARAPEVSWQR